VYPASLRPKTEAVVLAGSAPADGVGCLEVAVVVGGRLSGACIAAHVDP
jgi:hypothetical protein